MSDSCLHLKAQVFNILEAVFCLDVALGIASPCNVKRGIDLFYIFDKLRRITEAAFLYPLHSVAAQRHDVFHAAIGKVFKRVVDIRLVAAHACDMRQRLHARGFDGACKHRRAFSALAARLREAGKLVIGMGESKALGPFVKACDQFKYLDLILEHGGSEDASADSTAAAEAAAQVGAGDDTAINRDSICRLVCDMIDEMDDGTGWVRTSRVGDQLIKRYPDFDVRNFGSKSLNKFLASFPVLEVEERTLPNGNPIQFVRVHPQPKKAAPKKQNQPRKAAPKRRVPRNKKSS